VLALDYTSAILRLPVADRREPPAGARARQTTAGEQVDGWGLLQPRRYAFLSALGMLDSSTRGAALAFLPFLLLDKGLDASGVSWLFTVVFGGALGKFGCGWLGDRLGSTALIVTTELVTVAAVELDRGTGSPYSGPRPAL
jgi:hypothetical protein